jgi:hypothetical protein
LTSLIETPSSFQGMFDWSFTNRVMPYPSFHLNNLNSNVKSDIRFDAIKNLSLAARSALNLYECAVSASNAD